MATTLQTIREVLVRGRTEGMDQVKADLQGVAAAQQNVANSGAVMANVTDMASKRTLSVADALERHRRSLDATYRAQLQYERVQRDINAGIAAGIPGLERLSALNQQRYSQAIGMVSGVGRATELSTNQITGMTYQLNDLAVSLASGQSPFMVLMQQGMQVSQMFGPGSTLRSAAGALGSAFLSMLNPINLAVIGLAAAAGGASLLFSTISDEGDKSEDVLKRHADLIRSFKDAYGDAADGLRDYTAASQSVLNTQIRAGLFETQARFDALVPTTLGELGMRSRGRFSPNSPFEVFREEIEAAGKLALEGKPAFIALYDAVSGRANREPENKALTELALQLFDIIEAARQAEAQLKSLQDAQRLAIPPDARREAIIDRYQSQRSANTAAGFGIPLPRPSPLRSLAEDPFAAQTATARQLREEMALQLREAAIQSMDDIRRAADGVLSGFLNDLRQGADLWTAFGNAANRVIDEIADRLNTQLVDALLGRRGTTETGLIGSLFGFGTPTLPVGIPANSNVVGGAPVTPVATTALPALGAMSTLATGGGRALPGAVEGYRPTVAQFAQQYGVPTDLALAVMAAESRGNPNAVSPAGAIGLMQLMPGTARDLGVNPYDPTQNIQGGVRYLGQQYSRFGGDINRTLAAYNWGPARAARWSGDMGRLPAETRDYIGTVNGYLPAGGAMAGGADAAMATAAQSAQVATQSFQQLGGALQATTPQVGGFGQAIASLFSNAPTSAGGGVFSVFSGLFGSQTNALVPVMHSGGIAGAATTMRSVNDNVFAGARRMHTGGLAGDEVPAILRRGEGVFTREQMAAMGGGRGGSGTVVQIIDQRRKGSPDVQRKSVMGPNGEEQLRIIIRDENVRSNAPGGLNAKNMAANGIRRAYVPR